MKPTVSFLLGSGFSIPEGLPGVKKLNTRLSKIDESEKIYILTHIAVLKVNKPPRETLLSSWFYTCVYMCMCVCVCFF